MSWLQDRYDELESWASEKAIGVDLDEMRKICRNRKLRETYMSYYDELDKMSPRTIDYDNFFLYNALRSI